MLRKVRIIIYFMVSHHLKQKVGKEKPINGTVTVDLRNLFSLNVILIERNYKF